MKKAVVVLVAGLSAVVASAHPQDGDRLTALSEGTSLKTTVDINVPANVWSVNFANGKQLRVGVETTKVSQCQIVLKEAKKKDRVIPAGLDLIVNSTDLDSYRRKDYVLDPASGKHVKTEGAVGVLSRHVNLRLQSKAIDRVYCTNVSWVPAGSSSELPLGEANYPTIGQLKAAFGDTLQIVHPQPEVIDGEFEE